jgi:hypothetical protein
MSEVKFSGLDFSEIKNNLKNFLKNQNQFKDYDFDGSSMSILLDVLAYNTSYNAFYLNMLSSEMFLDSAFLRENVLSRAKHLGYVPNSVKSLRAKVDITFNYNKTISGTLIDVPNNIIQINRNDELYTLIDSKKYYFTVNTPKEILINENNRTVTIKDVELVEGKRFQHSYVVTEETNPKQKFIIPNTDVDISTLIVKVKKSLTNSTVTHFTKFNDITTLSANDSVYYIQPCDKNKYEVIFGDGILGKKLDVGNIVVLDYIVSSGDAATGAKLFKPVKVKIGSIDGSVLDIGNPDITITCKETANGFMDLESINSIKLMAPNFYQSQNRAVTKSDYETLLKKEIPSIEYLRVWGGEENDPPYYGKVFCAIKPVTGFSLNQDDKKNIIDNYIRPRTILSLDVDIVEPDYMGLIIDTSVNYLPQKTGKSDAEIKQLVLNSIKSFKENNLKGFDSDFRYSKLLKAIDLSDDSIESNDTKIKIKYRVIPTFNTNINYEIKLNNSISLLTSSNSIDSTPFFYKGVLSKISDDGSGKLIIYYEKNNEKVILNSNIGVVDYALGKINIQNLFVTAIPNGIPYIDILIKPKNNDIIAYRNQILNLDVSDINISLIDLNKVKLS